MNTTATETNTVEQAPTTTTRRAELEYATLYAEAHAENLRRDLDELEAGFCDHGRTCQGTVHHVDCSACYEFTYNGKRRGTPEEDTPFTCDASDLLAAVKRVRHGVSRKSYLPVLSGVLIDNGTLTTTDMDTAVRTHIDGMGYARMVAPAALLEKCLSKLSGPVTLDAREPLKLRVSAGSRTYTLNGWDPQDFPQVVRDELPTMHNAQAWRDAWSKVRHAVSDDDTRPILTCVSVNGRTIVATDSYRLALYELAAGHAELPEALISRRACEIVSKLKGSVSFGVTVSDSAHCNVCGGTGRRLVPKHPGTTDTCDVSCSMCGGTGTLDAPPAAAVFNVHGPDGSDTQVWAKPTEGQYPSYRQLIPDSFDLTAVIEKRAMVDALDAVSLMAQKNAPVRLSFNGRLTLRTLTQDVGTAEETIDYAPEPEPAEEWCIGFNPDYLADGLACVDSDTVTMLATNPLRPVILRGDDPAFTYLLMPIRLSDRSASFAPGAANRAACAA